MTKEEVAWCEQLWGMLNDGGVWGVPRSGLMFTKREARRSLELTARMPHEPEMPFSAEDLREAQDGDIAAIRQRFEALGIEVVEVERSDDG